jgi:hypothetical protein
MEIEIKHEDLSQVDCGGAYREASLKIFVDETLPPFKQRQALIYEILSAHLDPLECHVPLITELAHILAENLEQLK